MIEPAVSIERIFVAMLCDAYDEEVVGERERTVLRLHPRRAGEGGRPAADRQDEEMATARARSSRSCAGGTSVEHDDSGAIGRRYRRQDEIGTPCAFTIDEQTLEDETVTVRDRDSLAQERLPMPASPLARRGLQRRMANPKDVMRVAGSDWCSALAACGGTKTVTVTKT